MQQSSFFSTAEKIDLLNALYPELYDLLVSANENYYSKSPAYTFNIGGSTLSYSLPADFYKILGVDFQIGGLWTTVFPYNESDRNRSFNSNLPSGQVRLRYVPAPTTFSANDLSATVDGVSGWDELVVLNLAIAMLSAEESSTTQLERRLAKIEKRIATVSQNRDLAMPGTVTDVYRAANGYSMVNTPSIRYRLYGDSIEFMSVELLGDSIT